MTFEIGGVQQGTSYDLMHVTFPDASTCQWIDDGSLTGGLNGKGCFYRVKLQLTAPGVVWLKPSISRNGSGQIVLQFAGASGNSYAVEYTSNLSGGVWMPVPSPLFTFPVAGSYQWIDDGTLTGGLGGASRFYRVKQAQTGCSEPFRSDGRYQLGGRW